jgi:hypothetical protein
MIPIIQRKPYRKKINLSKSFAGQAVDAREVDDGIWLVSFMGRAGRNW